MFWIWIILWFIISLPIGKFFSKRVADNGIVALMKVCVFSVMGYFAITLNVNDALMIWLFLIFLGLSLTFDFTVVRIDGLAILGGITTIALAVALLGSVLLAANNNAMYFDSFIVKSDGFPIQNEVPDNMLRLTTKELAESIASQHMGEFGSAVKIVNSHIGVVDGRLYWLVTVANQEAWRQTFRTAGIIAVDANDPDKPVRIIKEKFNVAEGLDFNVIVGATGEVKAKGYYGIDTGNVYGDAYPVMAPDNKWYIALTAFRPDMGLVRRYDGVYQIDQHGDVVNHFKNDIPGWMIRPYDENSFLENGIKDWGAHRRGDGFDLFASGVAYLPPSNDRLEMTEDTRFIYDPDTNQVVAMVMVNPIRDNGKLSLAGAFKASSGSILYYDLRKYDLMSGIAASDVVKSKITSRSGSTYYTAAEILYPMKVNNQTKYVWYVPIYYQSQNSNLIGLAGLGIVDAQSADKVVVEYTGDGVTGSTLIKKARESFQALYPGAISTRQISSGILNGTIISKYDPYIKDGNTREWIAIATSLGIRDFLVRSDLLTDAEILEIQKAKKGDRIEFQIDDNYVVKNITF
jgi:hypothetical protein